MLLTPLSSNWLIWRLVSTARCAATGWCRRHRHPSATYTIVRHRRVHVSLVPLPSEFLVTCFPTALRRTWCPPETHLHTDPLCSAGSGSPNPFPDFTALIGSSDSHVSFSRRFGCPSRTAYLDAGRLFLAEGACVPQTRRRRSLVTGSPHHRISFEERLGLPGYGVVRLSRVPWCYTPPDAVSTSPFHGWDRYCLRAYLRTRHPGYDQFRGHLPTAHALARLRIAGRVTASVARLATGSGGLTPDRTGFAPAGRPTKFHEVIASFTPFRTA